METFKFSLSMKIMVILLLKRWERFMVKSKEETEEIKEKVGRYGIKPVLTLLLFLNLAFLVFSVSRIMGNISGSKPLIWLLLILSIIAIPVIPYGFLKRKKCLHHLYP